MVSPEIPKHTISSISYLFCFAELELLSFEKVPAEFIGLDNERKKVEIKTKSVSILFYVHGILENQKRCEC